MAGDDEAAEALAPGDLIVTTEVGSVAGRHALVPPFRLRVTSGADAGKVVTARTTRLVIGTHESADVVLTDRTVSRFHSELFLRDGRVMVRDLGSRNGTVVNGVSVVEAFVRPGMTLTLGKSELGFDLGADKIQIPLAERDVFGSLVGGSMAMRAAFALLERAAASEATVLLGGETGTGKEAAAESIHDAGARSGGPFVVVDCGAVPPELMESELFGHERGAFTGAVAPRAGAFEVAAGGTVFLDEIGELGLELQPKLLRALEKREFKRVGSAKWQPTDVRVIAATHRNLREEVNAKTFRADLYYRLAVLEVRLPALRERREDVPALVEHLLTGLGAAERPEAALLRTPECRADMARHAWPGNVRELRNYVERCLAFQAPAPLTEAAGAAGGASAALAEPDVAADLPLREARDGWTRDFERRYLAALLARHANNVTAAARAAGVDRKYLYRLLWKHDLR